MPTCETTKIVSDNKSGFVVVNTCDVKDTDKNFGETATVAPKKAAPKKKAAKRTKTES